MDELKSFIDSSRSANTLTKITSVTNFYKRCLPDGVPPFPLKLEYVIGFVFVMTKTGSYKASTISQYVSCLKSANRSLLCNIFNSSEEAILSDALKAAHKKLPDGGENQKRPLTVYEITSLAALEAVEGIQASDLEALTAATLIGIYGVMRSSEVLALQARDITFDLQEWAVLRVQLRSSKTDQLGRGHVVVIGCVEQKFFCSTPHCVVHRLIKYLSEKPQVLESATPLFSFNSDKWRRNLRLMVKVVHHQKDDDVTLGTHSLRRTGCQLLFDAGVSMWGIMEYGRWSSEAVHKYLKGITLKQSPQYAKRMLQCQQSSVEHSEESTPAASAAKALGEGNYIAVEEHYNTTQFGAYSDEYLPVEDISPRLTSTAM